MLFSRRRGNERDIFEIALEGTSLFRGSCIDVIKNRMRKNLKAPASNRFWKKCSERLKELDRNVDETEVDQTDADQTDANPGTDYKDIWWQDGRRMNSWTKNTSRAIKRVWRLWFTVKSNEHWTRTFARVWQLLIYSLYTCNLLNTVVTNKMHCPFVNIYCRASYDG